MHACTFQHMDITHPPNFISVPTELPVDTDRKYLHFQPHVNLATKEG